MWERTCVARELAPARLRSRRKAFGAASQPNGSKLPHHKGSLPQGLGVRADIMADSISLKKLVTRLLMVVVAMFVFGFALVPIYDVMCKAFGINGKTAGQYEGEQVVDNSRQVRVQFLSTNAIDMVWEFHSKADEVVVNP